MSELKPTFTIRRMSPEDTLDLINTWNDQMNEDEPKSYNITNDEQRYELVRQVLSKELTIKEVF